MPMLDLKITPEKFDETYPKGSLITICITKEIIDINYTDYLVDFYNAIINSENGKSCRFILTTNAYDNDAREVHQIPEYALYIIHAFERVPALLSLLDLKAHAWLAIILCTQFMSVFSDNPDGTTNVELRDIKVLGIKTARAMRAEDKFNDNDINKFKDEYAKLFGLTIDKIFY